MEDINNPEIIEISVRKDKKVIWINIDGRCILRITGPKVIMINEE